MTDIDWQGKQLVIPAKRMKAGRDHIVPLNETAMKHLRKTRTDREYILPLTVGDLHTFHKWFHKLQDLAGIPRPEHFGLHAIRRTMATHLWENNPEAATLALGHVAAAITRRHYVKGADIVARALDALPQPEAFSG